MIKRTQFSGGNQVIDFTTTKYEEDVMHRHGVNYKTIREARDLSKKVQIPLTLDTAVKLHQSGKLAERVKAYQNWTRRVEEIAESASETKLSKQDSDDDVAKMLKKVLDENDPNALFKLLVQCRCKQDQIDRIVTDMEIGEVNRGIIRMRAGNMVRNALRRRLK